jgi:hypothetical protein
MTGNTTVCAGSTNTYTVPVVSGASSYNWTLPGGWSGSSTSNSISGTAGVSGGTIMVTATNSCGTSAAQSSTITVNTVNVGVSTTGVTLTAAASPATYQWMNCGTNSIIGGQTNQNYTASANGNYAVIVTQNSCVDTSSCVNVSTVGIAENNSESFTIYPNPSTGQFTFELGTAVDLTENRKLEVFNVLGEKVLETVITTSKFDVDLTTQKNGIYFVRIETNKGVLTKKLIKK